MVNLGWHVAGAVNWPAAVDCFLGFLMGRMVQNAILHPVTTPPKSNDVAPEKWWDWKTIRLSYWGPVTLQLAGGVSSWCTVFFTKVRKQQQQLQLPNPMNLFLVFVWQRLTISWTNILIPATKIWFQVISSDEPGMRNKWSFHHLRNHDLSYE